MDPQLAVDVYSTLYQLQAVDGRLCRALQRLVDLVRRLIGKVPKEGVFLAGSGAEGAALARWFYSIIERSPFDLEDNEYVLYNIGNPEGCDLGTSGGQTGAGEEREEGGLTEGDTASPGDVHVNGITNASPSVGDIQSESRKRSDADVTKIGGHQATGSICFTDEQTSDAGKAITETLVSSGMLSERVPIREIEVDIMYVLADFPEECRYIVEPIDGKLGHVAVRVDLHAMQYVHRKLRKSSKINKVLQDGYVNSYMLKYMIKKQAGFSDRQGMTNRILGVILNCNHTCVRLSNPEEGISKASQTTDFWVRVLAEDLFKYACDNVPSMRIRWWPHEASEWLSRQRAHPTPEMVERIVTDGCHIIGRPSTEESERQYSRECRYSFSQPEITLALQRSDQQKLVYMLFKSMLYRHLKPLAPERLTSYLGKTTMLWVGEEYPPDDDMWAATPRATIVSLGVLVQELQRHIASGKLSHFFIRDINLLEEVSADIRASAVSRLDAIRSDLLRHVPENLGDVTRHAHRLVTTLEGSANLIRCIVEDDVVGLLPYMGRLGPLMVEVAAHFARRKDDSDDESE